MDKTKKTLRDYQIDGAMFVDKELAEKAVKLSEACVADDQPGCMEKRRWFVRGIIEWETSLAYDETYYERGEARDEA